MITPAPAPAVHRFSVGLEEHVSGMSYVHSLDVPGCIASGGSAEEALAAFELELSGWLTFLSRLGRPVPTAEMDLEISVDEWLRVSTPVESGPVGCFEADRRPLDRQILEDALETLGMLRGRLLRRIRRARNVDLERIAGPVHDLRTILDELARAHWWTLSRLGATPRAEVPDQVIARLDTSMALIIDRIGTLDPEASNRLLLIDEEEWTPRKVIRHLLWQEWSLGGLAIRTLDSRAPSDP